MILFYKILFLQQSRGLDLFFYLFFKKKYQVLYHVSRTVFHLSLALCVPSRRFVSRTCGIEPKVGDDQSYRLQNIKSFGNLLAAKLAVNHDKKRILTDLRCAIAHCPDRKMMISHRV